MRDVLTAASTDNFEAMALAALARLLRVDAGRLRPEALLAVDLKVDSLEFMTLIVGLERHFDVKLPDVEAARLRTVGEVIGALRKYATAPSSAARGVE